MPGSRLRSKAGVGAILSLMLVSEEDVADWEGIGGGRTSCAVEASNLLNYLMKINEYLTKQSNPGMTNLTEDKVSRAILDDEVKDLLNQDVIIVHCTSTVLAKTRLNSKSSLSLISSRLDLLR